MSIIITLEKLAIIIYMILLLLLLLHGKYNDNDDTHLISIGNGDGDDPNLNDIDDDHNPQQHHLPSHLLYIHLTAPTVKGCNQVVVEEA